MGAKTYYIYAGGQPILELDGNGNVQAVNTWGVDGLESRRNTGSASLFYAFDERGGLSVKTNASGAVIGTAATDAFGLVQGSGNLSDPFDGMGGQFGYETDAVTGLVLCGQRWYDPNTGRWLTRDPIGYAGGINLYGYVKNNPVMGIDPSGLSDDLWYDQLANWALGGAEDAKGSIFNAYSGWGLAGIGLSTASASAIDLVAQTLAFPAAIGHLGEGSGSYAGNPAGDPYGLGIWSDVGTSSAVLLAGVSLTPSGNWARTTGTYQIEPGYGEMELGGYNLLRIYKGAGNQIFRIELEDLTGVKNVRLPKCLEGKRVVHYHRRGPANPNTGETIKGQGIKRHRPFQVNPSDKNWRDRF